MTDRKPSKGKSASHHEDPVVSEKPLVPRQIVEVVEVVDDDQDTGTPSQESNQAHIEPEKPVDSDVGKHGEHPDTPESGEESSDQVSETPSDQQREHSSPELPHSPEASREESDESDTETGDDLHKTADSEPQDDKIELADESSPTVAERQKEVVKELFRKKDTFLDTEISMHEQSSPRSLVMWGVIVLSVAFLVSGGLIFTFKGSLPMVSLPSQPSPTPIPTSTPVPTPAVLSKSDIKLQVLNGSGVRGSAGQMQEFLEGLGYAVNDTGNAASYDYEKTEIAVKEGKTDVLDMLKADMEKEYSIVIAEQPLDASAEYDARITVGKE